MEIETALQRHHKAADRSQKTVEYHINVIRLWWIELKFVRRKTDIRPITKDIAEDITKYGDNQRRVLFVVYDPFRCITDEQSFAEQIVQHENMLVRFVR